MRKRLDEQLVERGLAPTRSRARDAIERGLVRVGSSVARKPGVRVEADAVIAVEKAAGTSYVSRGALKLEHGLNAFGFGVGDRVVLDIGASTGGFTQVLIERGARKVYAIDVGREQLHESLRRNPSVISMESTDARKLTVNDLDEPAGAIVADVSFISLTKVLPAVAKLARPGAWLIALVKPQFEVGRDGVGRGGIVRDDGLRQQAVASVRACIETGIGWRVVAVVPSPIEGGSGNIEYLIGASRDD